MAAAVRYIHVNIDESERAVARVYFNYNEQKTYTASKIWGSIIQQLAAQYNPFPAKLHAFRERHRKEGGVSPTVDDIIVLLESLLALVDKTFVFVDALVTSSSSMSYLQRRS